MKVGKLATKRITQELTKSWRKVGLIYLNPSSCPIEDNHVLEMFGISNGSVPSRPRKGAKFCREQRRLGTWVRSVI